MDELKEYSYHEVAELLGLSVKTVRSLAYRKLLQVKGYRPIRGKVCEAVVDREEVKRIINARRLTKEQYLRGLNRWGKSGRWGGKKKKSPA